MQPAFVYHTHDAPVPSVPPFTDKLELLPEQMVVGFAVALVAATDAVLSETVALAAAVLPHAPSALT